MLQTRYFESVDLRAYLERRLDQHSDIHVYFLFQVACDNGCTEHLTCVLCGVIIWSGTSFSMCSYHVSSCSFTHHFSQIHEVYRVAQKSLDTRGNMLNTECQVTFFPSCIPVSPIALYYPTLPRADYYSVAKV